MTENTDEIKQVVFGKEYIYVVVFVGLAAAGKTTFVKQLKGEGVHDYYFPTIGMDCQGLEIAEGVEALAFDIGGQKGLPNSLWKAFVKKAQAVVYVVDSTNQKRMEKAKAWFEKVVEWAPEKAPIMLLCNKIDLENSIEFEEFSSFFDLEKAKKKRQGRLAAFKVSAIQGSGVCESWDWLSKELLPGVTQ